MFLILFKPKEILTLFTGTVCVILLSLWLLLEIQRVRRSETKWNANKTFQLPWSHAAHLHAFCFVLASDITYCGFKLIGESILNRTFSQSTSQVVMTPWRISLYLFTVIVPISTGGEEITTESSFLGRTYPLNEAKSACDGLIVDVNYN